MLADEPVSVGGTNTGPAPFDLLCSALAACTTMTLKMYAERKKWPLVSSTCHVTHHKEAVDTADSDPETPPIDVFERVLTLEGDFSEAQRQRMMEIANRCPVHRTLHNTIEVRTTLATKSLLIQSSTAFVTVARPDWKSQPRVVNCIVVHLV